MMKYHKIKIIYYSRNKCRKNKNLTKIYKRQ